MEHLRHDHRNNRHGLPRVTISDGTEISLTPSTCEDGSGNQFNCFSIEGPPIVNTDGNTYMEYQVRQSTDPSNPNTITSATLYLLEIAPGPGDSSSSIQLSSTTDNTNLLPGRIIPDGQGGVIATWTISPVTGPVPTNPFQAAHVVSGSVAATYDLPFSPTTITLGQYPTLVLGENGTAFATDGMDSTNGPQIVSFDLSSGAVDWSYRGAGSSTLSLIASAAGNGLAAKITQGGNDTVIRLDASGNATGDNWSASGISNYGGNFWFAYSVGASATSISAAPVELSTSSWYAPDGKGGNAAKQNISVSNFSKTGPNQDAITSVLQKIQSALPNNATCNNWLQGAGQNQGTSGQTWIQFLLSNTSYGHATVNLGNQIDYDNGAFSGSKNADNSPVSGLPDNVAFTVNDVGAFFNSYANGDPTRPYKVGTQEYAGNTLRARAAMIIHEIAHEITIAGFQPDFGDSKAGRANDRMVDTNCRKLIEGFQ